VAVNRRDFALKGTALALRNRFGPKEGRRVLKRTDISHERKVWP